MEQLQVFNFEENEVRTLKVNGKPYFVAVDVCQVLEIKNSRDAVSRLDEDEKAMSVIPTQYGDKSTHIINESGLYSLIFTSRKYEAKKFKKWVTSEVLPAIRETGKYEVTKDPLEMLDLSLKAIKQSNERIDAVEEKVIYLENEVRLDSSKYNYLSKLVSRTIYETIDIFAYANTNGVQRVLRKDISSGINQLAGTRTRSQLKEKDFDKVIEFIQSWVPSTATRMEVQQLTLELDSENETEQ